MKKKKIHPYVIVQQIQKIFVSSPIFSYESYKLFLHNNHKELFTKALPVEGNDPLYFSLQRFVIIGKKSFFKKSLYSFFLLSFLFISKNKNSKQLVLVLSTIGETNFGKKQKWNINKRCNSDRSQIIKQTEKETNKRNKARANKHNINSKNMQPNKRSGIDQKEATTASHVDKLFALDKGYMNYIWARQA